jgi:hypothetical protein
MRCDHLGVTCRQCGAPAGEECRVFLIGDRRGRETSTHITRAHAGYVLRYGPIHTEPGLCDTCDFARTYPDPAPSVPSF